MSTLSAALAAALQNYHTVSDQLTDVISGRNFDLQDSNLNTLPYSCISVADLPIRETPFVGGNNGLETGQIEIRCISKVSEQKAKDIMEDVKAYLRSISTLPWDGSTVQFAITGWHQTPDTFDDLSAWIEILTVNYKAVAQ